ncbi:hypothetical protein G6M89_12785 [Natronolimnobius sp. AArcel1]|uniref:hypothetical protein n=1 Tax=Natronolimnobius sp. AArcel1 TaxID=1679093 RepID=UPI0013EABFBC|nr:hypothetical protein [Natronolimnobius sp. AArcel1]NGM69874.1 hypothetical protein [Natronolimnobius sp. AArcel1]
MSDSADHANRVTQLAREYDLSISLTENEGIEHAFEIRESSRCRRMDFDVASGRPLINSCVGGVTAEASAAISSEEKREWGILAYVEQTLETVSSLTASCSKRKRWSCERVRKCSRLSSGRAIGRIQTTTRSTTGKPETRIATGTSEPHPSFLQRRTETILVSGSCPRIPV